jgi:hypothetical protein
MAEYEKLYTYLNPFLTSDTIGTQIRQLFNDIRAGALSKEGQVTKEKQGNKGK